MGDDCALRAPRGARGEQDRGGVVLVDRGVGQLCSWCVIAKSPAASDAAVAMFSAKVASVPSSNT
ncbi:MAG: hypothetical protein EBY44_07300 [Actinobacteria bacterium]|nr:hypothetical protein [Actinomycetota bacterium]